MYNIFKNLKIQLLEFFFDLISIFTSFKKIIIWFFILPFNVLITLIIILLTFLSYLIYFFKFIFKLLISKLNFTNIFFIQVFKTNFNFKNYILNTFYILIYNISTKYGFLFLYKQLYFYKNININKNTFFKNIEIFLELLINIFIKRIFFYTTCFPFFLIKNNNKITFLINDVFSMNAENYEAYFSTICLNLLTQYTLEIGTITEKLKIKFENRTFYLNPQDIEKFVKNLKDLEKLSKGTNILIKSGKLSMLKYNIKNAYIPPHPSLYYDTIDKYADNKPSLFVINQSTKKYLKVSEKIKENAILQTSVDNKIVTKGIIMDDITAYNVRPHLVHKELSQLISSQQLINS